MRPAELNVTIHLRDGSEFGELITQDEWDKLNEPLDDNLYKPFIKVGDSLFSLSCVQAIIVE
jgi:hypothetical protein